MLFRFGICFSAASGTLNANGRVAAVDLDPDVALKFELVSPRILVRLWM